MTQATPSKPKQCTATRKDGRRCAAPAIPGGACCFAHAPELAEERRAARARGGRNRARAVRLDRLLPASLKPLLGQLLAAVEEVRGDEDGVGLTPAQAGAMAALAGAIVKVYGVGVIEERVAALEAAQEAAQGRRPA